MVTIMGSQRPRSKRSRSPRSPVEGESQGERARLRRNRPLTWRSAMLLLVPLVLLAAGSDVVFVTSAMTKCPHCGGDHIPLDITAMALAFTGLAVYACVVVKKEVRRGSVGRQVVTPPRVNAKSAERKESP